MFERKIHLSALLLLMAAGVALGADQYSGGGVSVLLPPSLASPLSVHNTGARAALQTASAVLANAGFVGSQTISPNARTSGQLAVFTRDVSFGSPTACDVFVRGNRLVFSFVETGIPNSSSATAQLSNQLANAFRARFGAASVEVQLK